MTSSNLRVVSLNPQVMSSKSPVMNLKLRVTSSNPRARRLKTRVG